MGYKIVKEISQTKDEVQETKEVMIKTDREHNMYSFEDGRYGATDTFVLQTATTHITDPVDAVIEVSRLVISCEKGHDHGVYYQAPRVMDVWEVMFAIGETGDHPEFFEAEETNTDDE